MKKVDVKQPNPIWLGFRSKRWVLARRFFAPQQPQQVVPQFIMKTSWGQIPHTPPETNIEPMLGFPGVLFPWCFSTCDVNQLLLLEGGRNAKLNGGGIFEPMGFPSPGVFFKGPRTLRMVVIIMCSYLKTHKQEKKNAQGLLTTCQQRTATGRL